MNVPLCDKRITRLFPYKPSQLKEVKDIVTLDNVWELYPIITSSSVDGLPHDSPSLLPCSTSIGEVSITTTNALIYVDAIQQKPRINMEIHLKKKHTCEKQGEGFASVLKYSRVRYRSQIRKDSLVFHRRSHQDERCNPACHLFDHWKHDRFKSYSYVFSSITDGSSTSSLPRRPSSTEDQIKSKPEPTFSPIDWKSCADISQISKLNSSRISTKPTDQLLISDLHSSSSNWLAQQSCCYTFGSI